MTQQQREFLQGVYLTAAVLSASVLLVGTIFATVHFIIKFW